MTIKNDNVRRLLATLDKELTPLLDGYVFDVNIRSNVSDIKKFYTDAGYRIVNSDEDIAATGNVIVEGRIKIGVDGSAKLIPVDTPV